MGIAHGHCTSIAEEAHKLQKNCELEELDEVASSVNVEPLSPGLEFSQFKDISAKLVHLKNA